MNRASVAKTHRVLPVLQVRYLGRVHCRMLPHSRQLTYKYYPRFHPLVIDFNTLEKKDVKKDLDPKKKKIFY